MINNLKEEIRKELLKESKYISEERIDRILIYILSLKYHCDNSNIPYESLIKETDPKNIDIEENILITSDDQIKSIKLLKFIRYENLKELVTEYLENNKIGIKLLNQSKKKICIANKLNILIYDLYGNTTYITNKLNITKNQITIFKFFDKVLNLNNKYSLYEDLNFEDYDSVYIYDNTPKYRFIKENSNDTYLLIKEILTKNNNLKIILHTSYKKISNLKQSISIIKYLSKVLLDEETAYLIYEKNNNQKVSIIDYNKDKINNLDKLFQIIENNRKQKDILVKITIDDIRNNYYRIGFKLYQSNIIETTKNINEIVDENTRLVEKLSTINKLIEEEINKLINR